MAQGTLVTVTPSPGSSCLQEVCSILGHATIHENYCSESPIGSPNEHIGEWVAKSIAFSVAQQVTSGRAKRKRGREVIWMCPGGKVSPPDVSVEIQSLLPTILRPESY